MRSIFTLTSFLTLFIVRRILHRGILEIKSLRWLFALGITILFLGFCVLGVVILRQIITEPYMLTALLRVAGTAVPLWVIAIYVAIRIMFMKAGQLVELTFNFPLTNRARALGFMAFEGLFVLGGVSVILGALISGTVSIGGVSVINEVITALLMPTVSCYLLINILYLIIERIILFLGFARLRSFFVPIILAVFLVAVYFGVTNQTERVLFSSVGMDDYFAIQLVYSEIADSLGIILTVLIWLVTVSVLVVITCFITSREFMPTKKFANLFGLTGKSGLSSYVAAYLRSIDTLTLCIIIILGSTLLFIINPSLPPFLLVALAIQGVYIYSSTESLRVLDIKRNNIFRDYIFLLVPQVCVFFAVSIPVSFISAAAEIPWIEILSINIFAISGIIIMTLSGIAFPAEKGNPFSVIIGIFSLSFIAVIILLAANLLGFTAWANFVILMLLTGAAVILSLVAMQKIERKKRYEMAS